jgi:two-component system, OmpR family, sensor histidine kinase KdpD
LAEAALPRFGMTTERKRPEDFLYRPNPDARGRLKVYIGFAAGVGKTYRMLEEAHALKRRGVDVVLGLIETHGRAETAALLEGLEYLPRRRVVYRGLELEEIDVDAIIARQPQGVVVDEVAHTNAPDARNRKRYQDVLDLIEARINVICAFNVQHLESLKDVVHRATGEVSRETVPDSFLRQADQVVNLDLATEDLLERLRTGKIYGEHAVARAHFFKEENLAALRELALREVAESLDRTDPRQTAANRTGRDAGRLMVCISAFSPRAAILLRRGSRLAGRLNTGWYVVYVETPAEALHRLDAEVQRLLLANIETARELGAIVVRLQSTDPVAALLNYARSHGVGHIMIGRSGRPWWQRILGTSFVARMIKAASGLDLYIIALEDAGERP